MLMSPLKKLFPFRNMRFASSHITPDQTPSEIIPVPLPNEFRGMSWHMRKKTTTTQVLRLGKSSQIAIIS